MSWSLATIWNQSLITPERDYEPRERIWASELGGAYIDRYLKMKGTPPTNPPNGRSKRKMEAGKIWESIVAYVLTRAGVLIEKQQKVHHQYPGLLPVSGYLDFIAGGMPDYEMAISQVKEEFSFFPDSIRTVTKNLILYLQDKHPDGLKEIIFEIKSCSSMMFDVYDTKKEASDHHKLQNFHYLKGLKMDEGRLTYICRDDARICEYGVFNPSPLEEAYRADIQKMTDYFNNSASPPKEKEIIFDPLSKRFKLNWKIAYSSYLKLVYGYESQAEFEANFQSIPARWNRIILKLKNEDKLTDDNKKAIDEMRARGFNIEELEVIKES